jgi:uncharacterized membrane protein (UPF0127 family)
VAYNVKLIVNLRKGEPVCIGEIADRPVRRMRGLIGRRGLGSDQGMLIRPAPSIHTAFMRFPIDALFLDRDLRVLDIVERMRPWRVAGRRKARAVLELAAGESARLEVRVGDQLELRDLEADAAHSRSDGARVNRPAAQSSPSIIWPDSLPSHDGPGAGEPMRVLVISRDRHFRKVTSMLLSHRGCSVNTTAKASGAAELINRDRADVVVVEAGRSPVPAHTAVAAAAVAHPVGIVVVDEAPSGSQQPPVLAKWGPFEDLFAAIARAASTREVISGGDAS